MFHTDLPEFYLSEARLRNFKESGKFYQNMIKKIPKGTSHDEKGIPIKGFLQLREISSYGAILDLALGKAIYGNLEYHQITKKKLSFGEILFFLWGFHGHEDCCKDLKAEIKKHGAISFTRSCEFDIKEVFKRY